MLFSCSPTCILGSLPHSSTVQWSLGLALHDSNLDCYSYRCLYILGTGIWCLDAWSACAPQADGWSMRTAWHHRYSWLLTMDISKTDKDCHMYPYSSTNWRQYEVTPWCCNIYLSYKMFWSVGELLSPQWYSLQNVLTGMIHTTHNPPYSSLSSLSSYSLGCCTSP
jgi:hypothetical protein